MTLWGCYQLPLGHIGAGWPLCQSLWEGIASWMGTAAMQHGLAGVEGLHAGVAPTQQGSAHLRAAAQQKRSPEGHPFSWGI